VGSVMEGMECCSLRECNKEIRSGVPAVERVICDGCWAATVLACQMYYRTLVSICQGFSGG
jgi:hypothetical protein